MTQLTELDEHFYHQTPSPVDALRDTDPRYVDQHWFQCMDTEGRWIVGANWPVWPNAGMIENGQIIVHGDTQYNLRYSSTIEQDGYKSVRTNQQVGPASMEVIDPLRKARFTLSPDNHWGISYDLTMDTYLRPVQTRTPIAFAGSATLPGLLPYFEIMGRWTGELNVDGVTYEVNHENTWGQRDRCWASLGGERWQGWTGPAPGGGGVSPRGAGRIHWHSHIQFDDIGFWWWMDEFMGKPRLGGTLADKPWQPLRRGGHLAHRRPARGDPHRRLHEHRHRGPAGHAEVPVGPDHADRRVRHRVRPRIRDHQAELDAAHPRRGLRPAPVPRRLAGRLARGVRQVRPERLLDYPSFRAPIWDGEHACAAVSTAARASGTWR